MKETNSLPHLNVPLHTSKDKDNMKHIPPTYLTYIQNTLTSLSSLSPGEVLWFTLFMVTTIHIITFAGFYYYPISYAGFTYALIMYVYSGFGITIAYHRLWSHRSYDASWVWKLFWSLGGCAALQGSIRWWCRLHRLHHSFSDTDVDPYGPNKGFLYSHILWIFHKKDRKVELSKINISDLQSDVIARQLSQHYVWLSLFMAFGVPLIVFEDKTQAFLYGGCLARVFTWHSTWFVNSLAHWLGDDEYSNETSAKDHLVTALLTLGEGNHGFHHAFPTSYKNGVRWYHYDPTKWLIELGSVVGLCFQLKHPEQNEIEMARYQIKEKKLVDLGETIVWPAPPKVEFTFSEFLEKVKSGKQWITFKGTIYDIQQFSPSHPGGTAIINGMVGKDPSTVENFMTHKHTHTKAARNLMDTLAVAKLTKQ